jgi:hypothetical protein
MLSFKLFRLLEAVDPREGERDRDYHPVIKYYGKDYHGHREGKGGEQRTHYELLRHIAAIHDVPMSHLDAAHDSHNLYFGLKHKKTGKITWSNF